jgi:hypothetical protein
MLNRCSAALFRDARQANFRNAFNALPSQSTWDADRPTFNQKRKQATTTLTHRVQQVAEPRFAQLQSRARANWSVNFNFDG